MFEPVFEADSVPVRGQGGKLWSFGPQEAVENAGRSLDSDPPNGHEPRFGRHSRQSSS
jgi:hypothetical protein